MANSLTEEQRRALMSRVRNRNTAIEMVVRKLLHGMGFRFRLHRRDLPGTPDIVLPRHRKVIFVHGCFWHGHEGCTRGKRPASNTDFWNNKIDKNIERDQSACQKLCSFGWDILTIWGCEVKDLRSLEIKLSDFLNAN